MSEPRSFREWMKRKYGTYDFDEDLIALMNEAYTAGYRAGQEAEVRNKGAKYDEALPNLPFSAQ
jgi:hypothetical protein